MATVTTRAARRPRAYVRVKGPDAEEFLQRMVSNDVAQGDVVDALLLTPKARLIAPLRVLRRGSDDFLLLTEPELGETVRTSLLRARLASKCEIEPEQHTSTLVWSDEEGFAAAREELDVDVEPNVDAAELERLRIEQGVPAWGSELDDSILPAEAGLDETHISFTKGCYPGQEPIARLHYRGHVNRRLRGSTSSRRSPATRFARRQSRRPRDERGTRPCARLCARRRGARRGAPGRRRRGEATLTVPQRP